MTTLSEKWPSVHPKMSISKILKNYTPPQIIKHFPYTSSLPLKSMEKVGKKKNSLPNSYITFMSIYIGDTSLLTKFEHI